ncbi:transcription termination/antitermination protein NusA [Candidatus Uhrbacteria bacterium]|nr:transcription termination/antitermination protein NusA [Candidatus Uhrbacteria bacterium]
MASPIVQAIKQICEEKNLSYEAVLQTVEEALAAAYRKDFDHKREKNVKVSFDPESGAMRVFDVKTVVPDMELPEEGEEIPETIGAPKVESKEKKEEKPEAAETSPAEGEEAIKFNPRTMIMISEARKLKPDAAEGEEIRTELEVPGEFGRMAAQTAKQVIMQKLREAEREVVFKEYKDREGQVIIATAQRWEGKMALFDVGKTTAIMPPEEQIAGERYQPGERMKVFVVRVALTSKGPEIVISRAHQELVRKLFSFEIPEVANGTVEIKSIAREAGERTKVAVSATDPAIDPIGSCIGQRGTRIQTIIAELGGEKIDVIAWDQNQEIFIANALSPAKVVGITVNIDEGSAMARVLPEQLSLAIGRGGQNVRLAAKLTGLRITVVEEKPKGEETAGGESAKEESEAPAKEIEEGTTETAPKETPPEKSE